MGKEEQNLLEVVDYIKSNIGNHCSRGSAWYPGSILRLSNEPNVPTNLSTVSFANTIYHLPEDAIGAVALSGIYCHLFVFFNNLKYFDKFVRNVDIGDNNSHVMASLIATFMANYVTKMEDKTVYTEGHVVSILGIMKQAPSSQHYDYVANHTSTVKNIVSEEFYAVMKQIWLDVACIERFQDEPSICSAARKLIMGYEGDIDLSGHLHHGFGQNAPCSDDDSYKVEEDNVVMACCLDNDNIHQTYVLQANGAWHTVS
jgi:hypothetical protein